VSTSLPDIGHVTTSQVDGLEIRPELKQALPRQITRQKTTAEKRRMDDA
jgi:hypothetical protein